ncbi:MULTISPECIES: immunity 52 family protein [Xenorhabdus]|uniref:immunity 52 family protein n=1 Tax=Xenorhabdus TaxID=626 RepID=UPI0006456E18|nr:MULTISPECIES: immunity 52 family protein [Xenorhabdus]
MPILNLDITLFYDLKEEIDPVLVLNDTYQIMQMINELNASSSGWHLPGYSLKEITENNVFNENGFTDYAKKWYEKDFDKENKSTIKTLFDKPGNVKIKNTIRYITRDITYSTPNKLGHTNVTLDLKFEKENFNKLKFIDFINKLISFRIYPFVMVETSGYTLNQKQVFPDRLSAGWMLYLPIEIDSSLLPMAEEIIPITDKHGSKGSLIITTKEIFDIENKAHINKANDIEICLRDLGLLPLYSEV